MSNDCNVISCDAIHYFKTNQYMFIWIFVQIFHGANILLAHNPARNAVNADRNKKYDFQSNISVKY